MKKALLLSLLLLTAPFAFAQLQTAADSGSEINRPLNLPTLQSEEEIIAYWNQNSNDLPGGGFGFLADPSVFPQAADLGNGFLSIGGGNITASHENTNGDVVYSWVPSFAGTTINAQGDDPSGGSISFQGGDETANNGAYMQLEISMEGYEGLNISYATRGTSSGFDTQTWSWSTDGSTFTDFATVAGTNASSFFLVEESAPADVNDAETVYLRVTFDGSTGSTGNNRVDNIVLAATPAGDDPPPPVGDNIVFNGDFSDGLNYWSTFLADWEGVTADFDVVDGEAAITNITNAGGQVWWVQFNQLLTTEQIDALEVGETYKIQFDARSNVDGRQLTSYFGEDGGGFTALNLSEFNLSTIMETYEADFVVTQTFGAMKLGFEMGLSNDNVFIDNVSLMITEGDGDTSPTTAAPTPTADEENVISVFSDAYTNLDGTDFNPDWGQSTQVETIEIEGSATLKYSSFNYQGTQFASAIDASGMTTMHLDMWTADATSVNFSLISTGPQENAYALPITAGEWVSYEIPLSHFDNVNLEDIIQFKFDGGDSTPTIYLDNLYFSGEEDAPVENLIINGDFSDGLNSWSPFIADWEGVTADFNVVDGEAAITNITNAGGEVWHVQLNQLFTAEQIAALEVGEYYKAQFEARSNVDGRQLRFYFGEDGGGFTPLNISDFNITTEMQTYEAVFEVTTTFGAMKFGFEMGLTNDDVYIDNVSLAVTDEIPVVGPPMPDGFIATDMIGDVPVGPGEIFVAAGPNQTAEENIIYRLFYAPTADAPETPQEGTEHQFGTTPGDGEGIGPFGFVIGDLLEGTEYTFWLYQFYTDTEAFSEPAIATAVSGGEGDDPPPGFGLPLTFEEDIDWNTMFVNFDGGTTTVIDNPDPSGINTSDKVARMIKGTGQPWGGSYLNLGQPVVTTDGPVSVMVWAPREDTKLLFKIEHETDNSLYYEVEQTIPAAGEWTELTFDLSGADSDVEFTKVIFIFDLGTAGDGSPDFTWYFDNIDYAESTSTDEDRLDVPTEISLGQNYPNPFNPTTQIQYTLPESGHVKLDVYTITGQRVATLVNENMNSGNHVASFNASALASGVYLYRLQAGSVVITKKMTLLK